MWEGEDDAEGGKEIAFEDVEEEDDDEKESPPPRQPRRGTRVTKTASLYTNDSDKGQEASGAPERLPTIISDNEDSEPCKTLLKQKQCEMYSILQLNIPTRNCIGSLCSII